MKWTTEAKVGAFTIIGIALFSVITVGTASLFYSTQVSPKINEITKTINENKQYLSSIPDSIFNDVYSDKDFNDDIKLFDRIHNTLTTGKNSKEMNEKKISLQMYWSQFATGLLLS